MRRSLIVLSIALAAVLAACTSSTEPGWTYAPPTEPPASVAPSGDASAPPASEAPSGEAPSGDAGDGVTLTAAGTNWVEKELAAPADTAFTITFDNQDSGMPHDVVIKDSSGAEKYKSEVVTGPAVVDLPVPALAAGSYQYVCSIHPNMIGTLTAGS